MNVCMFRIVTLFICIVFRTLQVNGKFVFKWNLACV